MADERNIDAAHHPMVMAAMARMAREGGWGRVLQGKPLEEFRDLHDAELLVAVGVLRVRDDGVLEPSEPHPWYFDPPALAGGMLAALRHAVEYAEGSGFGWSGPDLRRSRDQGRASASAARSLGESLMLLMPEAHQAFSEGRATFLDVGVGVGHFSREICRMYPGVSVVGIDVQTAMIDLAGDELHDVVDGDHLELRVQSVAELPDQARFDLAWLPQAFIPREDLLAGVVSIFRALKPRGWLVAPVCALVDADPVRIALAHHSAALTGGGSITVDDMTTLLLDAGFDQIRAISEEDQTIMLAVRP